MKIFFLLITALIALLPSSVFAGGEYWKVQVKNPILIVETNEVKLLLLQKATGLVKECKEIRVFVEHKNISMWSWLPFIHSSHPTEKETRSALDFLNNTLRKGKSTFFGYIGGGLSRSHDDTCVFKSKGLRVEEIGEDKKLVVFSFHDPV